MLFNLAPSDSAPFYANESYEGVNTSWLWEQKNEEMNKTMTAEIMSEHTRTVNAVFLYQAGFETVVKCRWVESQVAVFDVHRLVSLKSRPFPGHHICLPFLEPHLRGNLSIYLLSTNTMCFLTGTQDVSQP